MTVNGKKVAIPSYQVKANDIIKVKTGSDRKKVFSKLNETLKKAKMPSWLYLNVGEMSGKVLNQPSAKDLTTNINTQMIVEFYSR